MRVIDPGHKYELLTLDGELVQTLTFVKRHDSANPQRYPGNFESHPGTTLQSVIRALIERANYLQGQIPCEENTSIIGKLEDCLHLLEIRAARRHGIPAPTRREATSLPLCPKCGHVACHH